MELALFAGNIVMLGAFLLRSSTFPPQIPLFYIHQVGEDQLGEWWMIFLLPVFLDLFYFLNKFIATKVFQNNTFISRVVYYVNLFLIIVVTFIFIRIIILIT